MKIMKELKGIIFFVLRFFAVYLVLLILYNYFLSTYHSRNEPDPYSRFVAIASAKLSTALGFETEVADDKQQPWVWVYTEGNRTSYINEGCNAISIIIIFIAFIVAFYSTWKKTLLYILSGSIIIQAMNVIRISILNYVFRFHPSYGKVAHDYLFPMIIYGTIFLLWIIWVKYVVMKKSKKNEQST